MTTRDNWIERVASLGGYFRGGVAEVILSLLFTLPLLYFAERYLQQDRWGFAPQLLIGAGVMAVGRFPRVGSLVVGVGITLLAVVPSDNGRYLILAALIPVASLGARGLRAWQLPMVVWYVIAQGVVESGTTLARDFVDNLVMYAFMNGFAVLVGEAVRSVFSERTRLKQDRVAAVQAQRRSIARDLHDTVAYSTTSIILRAEQAKLRGVPDPQLLEDLDYIIGSGRQSIRDLRGMMETLRRNEPQDEERSPWQISSLNDVITARLADLTANGFRPSHHVDADLAALPDSIRETLAKVVVEATGNMVKHGEPGTPCSILIEQTENDIEAVFINVPARSGTAKTPKNNPLGLLGAQERVEALGGECEVTSTHPTWVMRVTIPLGA